MYNNIANIINDGIGLAGTVIAVLSILNMKFSDIWSSITYGGIAARDEELLIQRRQARTGVIFAIYSWLLKVILIFVKVKSRQMLAQYISFVLLIGLLLYICVEARNDIYDARYKETKEEQRLKNKYPE